MTITDYRTYTRKSVAVFSMAALAMALTLTGCSEDTSVGDDEYAQVCQNKNTGERVDDNECEHPSHSGTSNPFLWYYLGTQMSGGNGTNSSIPAVGSKLTGGTTSKPSNATMYKGIPAKGGSFYESYTNAKSSETVKNGKTSSKSSSGKAKGSGTSGKGSGSKGGGFGGGKGSGGGHAGG